MPSCSGCGQVILFGGVQSEGRHYCGATCQAKEELFSVADSIPNDVVMQSVRMVHQGDCPKCNARGPVDIHVSHSVVSFLVMTRWKSTPQLCCRRCGVKSQVGRLVVSSALGWWGFPWGLVITPFQIVRNILAMVRPPDPATPSQKLIECIRLRIATDVMASPRANNESFQMIGKPLSSDNPYAPPQT